MGPLYLFAIKLSGLFLCSPAQIRNPQFALPPPSLAQLLPFPKTSNFPSVQKGVCKRPMAKRSGANLGMQAWAKWLLWLDIWASAASAMQTVSMVDFCGQTLQGDGMVLTSHRDSRRFYFVVPGTDCHLTLQAASPRDQVAFQFRFFLVYSLLRLPSSTPLSPHKDHPQETPDLCISSSYVQFYDGKDPMAKPLGMPLCGKNIPRPLVSSGNFLTLRFVTRDQQPRVDFVGDFTSLRTGLNASACSAEAYFPCRNGKCIPPSLVCDGSRVDNCGDGTDQSPARCKGSPTRLPLLPAEASSVASVLPKQVTCARGTDQADNRKVLLASLASLFGAALLFWCCWNPGWFFWRVGACRFLPGCNAFCAACHLCAQSCTCQEQAKVTPHGAPEPSV
ncbi:low-density lipoprotein receptor class A domain-containing protein 2 [Sceloporus undulatus]|uniref:low-density lipoprotein receptor class A domain-containing protein 2 n=1 Tax=Sceloporus undulatus TaxID=8520 RepID=UPI001C4AB53D|nr:low-density lipoprotein receptor class A domain-containing protein 2 [Sceloporus undulatus]